MSNKRILKTAFILCLTIFTTTVGMYITNNYSFTILNMVLGFITLLFIYFFFLIVDGIANILFTLLPRELQEQADAVVDSIKEKTVKELEDEISFDKLILPMSDEEFYNFLSKDRYGNEGIDKESILNLLSLMKDRVEFASKEKIIYKKLSEIKS